ncbi:MAG: class I SAM-dependent methyltransferase [Pseudomonadota bacterium]
MSGFFSTDASRAYDEKNRRLAPIADGLHFLARLALKDLPPTSRALCVGVGTGAEILSLSQEYPGWRFTGVDPSAAMLEVCRERLTQAGVMDRCELVEGYVQDVEQGENFDAALSILVGHFVKLDARADFYGNMQGRLKPGGMIVNAEISFDLDSAQFPPMLTNWERVQALLGANPESLKTLATTLREGLTVLPPAKVESLLRASGFPLPVRFFQAFMIMGWHAVKPAQ